MKSSRHSRTLSEAGVINMLAENTHPNVNLVDDCANVELNVKRSTSFGYVKPNTVISKMVRCLPDMACVTSVKGVIVTSNDEFEQMFSQECVRSSNNFLDFMTPHDRASFENAFLMRSTTDWLVAHHLDACTSSQWYVRQLVVDRDPLLIISGRIIQPQDPIKPQSTRASHSLYASLEGLVAFKSLHRLWTRRKCSRVFLDDVHDSNEAYKSQGPEEVKSGSDDVSEMTIDFETLTKFGDEQAKRRRSRLLKAGYRKHIETCHAETKSLNHTLEMKRTFVKAVAHEIRTPLSIVMSGLSLLVDEHTDDPEYQQTIADMQQACASAVDIVGDFITYEKLESNLCKLELRVENVADLLRKCLQPFSVQARHRGVLLRFINEQESERFVNVDAYKLNQVLRNLVSNAIKFSRSGGEVSVRLLLTMDKRVRIEVVDQGAGMSAANQTRLFSEIVQFDAGKLQGGGGSGIGLWISKKLMDAHGGLIGVSSEGEGHGCCFFVDLDICDDAMVGPMVSSSEGGEGGTWVGLRVLIADDSEPIRKMTSRLLVHMGAETSEASDGTDCLALVSASLREGRAFDAVLIDCNMRLMHGPETTAELRRLGYPGKIIGVTGSGSEEELAHFLAAGLDSVYVKPITAGSLGRILSDIMR